MIVDPRLNEPPQPDVRYPEYAENGSAKDPKRYPVPVATWTVLALGIVLSAVFGSITVAVLFALALLLIGFVQVTSLIGRLPLGIRMDQQGIRIGGVQAAEEGRSRVHPRDRPIRGFTRAMHVYSCEWEGVQRIKVLTDPRELRAMARGFGGSGSAEYRGEWWSSLNMAAWAPGRFVDVLTGAALVIEVETARASFQATRPPKGGLGGSVAADVYTGETMTWVIPTRNPQAIKAALAAARPPVYEG